ncbi:TBC1 domain family member 7-like [Ornithodoros turicata]|uniref:TBC1 domain family member 7-like n=1 Tax=Ornithodoros turicata TaxID=34597 RepID=UPI0031395455
MAAEINFRSHYYDKVGFRCINENKSIEALLNEKPVDPQKLLNFCRKFCVPSIHRHVVWKILLGILPTYDASIQRVEDDQKEQWKCLRNALEIMRIVNETTPLPDAIVLMYLLGEGKLNLDIEQQLQEEEMQHLRSIASAFSEICNSEQEVYWMTRNFWKLLKGLPTDTSLMTKQMEDILDKEDHELYQHLIKVKAMSVLPVDTWFQRCFADVLDTDALVRVWDRVVGGSTKILPQVATALLTSIRSSLMHHKTASDILQAIENVPKEASSAIISKTLA